MKYISDLFSPAQLRKLNSYLKHLEENQSFASMTQESFLINFDQWIKLKKEIDGSQQNIDKRLFNAELDRFDEEYSKSYPGTLRFRNLVMQICVPDDDKRIMDEIIEYQPDEFLAAKEKAKIKIQKNLTLDEFLKKVGEMSEQKLLRDGGFGKKSLEIFYEFIKFVK